MAAKTLSSFVAFKSSVRATVVILAISCWSATTDGVTRKEDPFCDRTGQCSNDMLSSSAPMEAQKQLMDNYKNTLVKHGVNSGCYRVYMTNSDGASVPVYFYFSCRNDYAVNSCFDKAVQNLKAGCPGRAGGIVKRDNCYLRYELYDICGLD